MAEHQNAVPRRTRAGLWLLLTIFGLAVLFAAGYGAWRYSNAVPPFRMARPPLPSPNAYDFYLRAAKMIQAVPNYRSAYDSKTPAQAEAIVEQCRPALRVLREGFTHAYETPYPGDALDAVKDNTPRMLSAQVLGKILIADSRALLARGNTDGALDSALDAMRLATDVPRGGVVMNALIGTAVEGMGFEQLLSLENHLSAAQCRRAAQRLAAIEARRVPLADVLRTEHGLGRELLTLMARDPAAFETRVRKSLPPHVGGSEPHLWNLRMAAQDHDRWFTEAIRQAPLPPAQRSPLPQPRSTLARISLPAIERFMPSYEEPVVAWRLLRADLALRAYRLEHGQPPAALADLVPRYLAAVPEDPMAPGQPLGYHSIPQPVVYSVGPDGQDNGGRGVVWTDAHSLGKPGDPAAKRGDLLLRAARTP